MRLTRLRSGEIVAGLGAAALLVSLFLDWFELADPAVGREPGDLRGPTLVAVLGGAVPHQTGWGSLGWLALVPLVATIALTLALVVATVVERTPALPLALGVMIVPVALLAVLVILLRLVAQPDLGTDAPDAEVVVRWPAYLGLAGAAAALVGAWIALGDERTNTAEARAQTERALRVRGEPRPVPPPRDEPS
jgi:hypothetical protein